MRRGGLAAAARLGGVTAIAAALAACAADPPAEDAVPAADGPGVLLITLDTFRADHLGASGHPTVRTPYLDRLARRSGHWTQAVTAIPLTTPSHATILTGVSPRTHGLLKNRMVLPEEATTVAEVLKAAGYRTGAVVSSFTVLAPELNLDQGFDHYEVVEPVVRPASGEGARTTEAAAAWLAQNGGPGSFLWVHYFDAHLPYLPPPPLDVLYNPGYEGKYRRPAMPVQKIFQAEDVDPRDVEQLVALYASEVTFLDRCVGHLLRSDGARGAAVLLTADHGEGLWEHDRYFGHDILLYETSVRVPLLLSVPGQAGSLSREPARTMDAAPTILALCGIERFGMEGRDLRGDPPPTGDALQFPLETYPQHAKSRPIFAMRTETEKAIWNQRERRREFYDLRADPGERSDFGGNAPRSLRVLAEDLEIELRERPPGQPRTIDEAEGMDEETKARLQALGYIDS